MINRLGNLTAAGTLNVQTSNRRVTHLLIGQNTAFVTADKLTVQLLSRIHEPIVLVNRVSCLALQSISDFKFGQSQGLQVLLNAGLAVGDYIGFFLSVPLGNLDLVATESELQVTFETVATIATVSTLMLEPDSPDRIERTLELADLNGRQAFVEEIFLHFATGTVVPFTDTATNDITIQVTEGDHSDVCTLQDAISFTGVFGEIEAQAPLDTWCIYANQDDIPDDVGWNITGSDAASVKVLLRTKEYKTKRLVSNMVTRLDRAEKKIAIKSPGKQDALRLAGVGAELGAIRQAKAAVTQLRNKQRASGA